MSVSALLGARAYAVAFGDAHFRVDFSDAERQFSLSTQADVSLTRENLDFRESKAVSSLVDVIGAALKNVHVDDDCRAGLIEFDNGIRVRAWWPDKIYDNLFLVLDDKDGAWFVLG